MSSKKTVLVFHPNSDLLAFWKPRLGSYAEVFTTSSPQDAVALYKTLRPEIVVAEYCETMEDHEYVIRSIRDFEDLIQRKSVVFATSVDSDKWNVPLADQSFKLRYGLEKLEKAILLECSKNES